VHVYGLTRPTARTPSAPGTPTGTACRRTRWRRGPRARARLRPVRPRARRDDTMQDVAMDGETAGRGGHARQQRDEGLLRAARRQRRGVRGGCSTPATSRSGTRRLHRAARSQKRLSFRAARTISTIEVEQAVARHPAVMECAVVAVPDDKWASGPRRSSPSSRGCRRRGRGDRVLPPAHRALQVPGRGGVWRPAKTSTGKVQKFVLRDKEWKGRAKRIN